MECVEYDVGTRLGQARRQAVARIGRQSDLNDLVTRPPQRISAFPSRRQRHLAFDRGSAHQDSDGVGCPARPARHVLAFRPAFRGCRMALHAVVDPQSRAPLPQD